MTGITIRDMRDADRERVVDLLWQLNVVEGRLSDTRSERREDAAACLAWNDDRIRDGGAHLVADVESEVAGYMCLVVQTAPPFIRAEFRRHLYVAELVVHERMRGGGLGTALLDAAEAYARNGGLGHILIGSTAGNEGADRLYASRGFALYGIERLKRLA
jgi:GNAT superfamily N-acetyltransferase